MNGELRMESGGANGHAPVVFVMQLTIHNSQF